VVRAVGTHAYELDIPDTMKNHRTFPVSLLNPASSDPLPGQIIPPPLPVVVDGEKEWSVDAILDSRLVRGRLKYLVKWTGYDPPEWEAAEGINGLEAIDRFHELYPHKPGPLLDDS
jgi:hypothetical protein